MATRELMSAAAAGTAPAQRLHIFILVDAFGWEYLKSRSFIPERFIHRQPLTTVLGFSSGAIPTILTGVFPERNGHWNLFYYDPKGSPFRWMRAFGFLPKRVLDHRVTRKIVKELGRRVLGMGPMFECYVSPRLLPWFNFIEKKSIYALQGITGAPSIFDRLKDAGIPFRSYSYHSATDAEIIAKASADINGGETKFLFLYLSELDAFLHAHCSEPERIDEKLAWYEQELRDLFTLAEKSDPEFRVSLFSDHGMTPITEHFDLVGEIAKLGFRMPEDYLAVYDSTMARFWFFNEECRQQVTSALEQCTAGRVLAEAELREFGVFFEDRRFGESIFLLHPGWLIAKSDFNGKGWNPVGMHGYHPDDKYSDAVFCSNFMPVAPMHNVRDVFDVMHQAMDDLVAAKKVAP